MFSLPDSSGWNPAPSSSRAEILPLTVMEPASGRRMRAMHFNSVLLPEPFSPISPNVVPAGTWSDTSSRAWNSS